MSETRRARLVLPAAGTAPAVLDVEPQPRSRRTTRAAVILGGSVLVAPAAVFLPPHFLWPLAVLATGLFLARREWRGEYVVRSFAGDCPRCGTALSLDEGRRIRSRERVECYGCHREPELVLEPPEDPAGTGARA